MSRTILVAGASGALGSEIVRLLLARGDRVRALGRDASRLARLRAAGVETVVADAADAAALRPAVDGVDAVISSLGASTLPSPSLGWRGFGAVDLRKNRNLVDAARAAGARKMVYVSVFHDPDMRRGAYVDAHEGVVDHLRGSGMEWSAVRPTGFFSAVGTFVDMASKGRLPSMGDGKARSNPIHDVDLAAVCVEALDGSAEDVPCGGPEVLSRSRMGELAFEALGRPVKLLKLPIWMLKMNGVILRPFFPRIAQLMQFYATISSRDVIAPVRGTRKLGDYFKERATALQQAR